MAVVAPTRRPVRLCLGKAGLAVGSLVHVRQGRREHSAFAYDENWLADAARFNVSADLQLNLLITNVDDHLQNHGFLHVERGQWRLAPVFDINPFPDQDRESKTWLTEQDGPITDVQMLLARASYFALDGAQALAVLGEVHAVVSNWRQTALGPEVGLRAVELDDFAPAFEHEQMDAAAALLGR
ncbi:HipA domain-containing protein [Nitrosovibrio sp. Nv17]|uniref:HipA domain-containing protein n=1 Tax=Nitrosovibrio sp. Nv17 TaxID=1855339 RepID=UPI000908C0C8|nr:HipA domain-containing protein [Nitrosovibrio sp. Nv17]SFW26243.1 HipA-like C-terminal domain-containing protein [Nitrosovibrio sp. Nv17]